MKQLLDKKLHEMTMEELQGQAQAILDINSHWKRCGDGSYEQALSLSKYYDILEEIRRRKNEKISSKN